MYKRIPKINQLTTSLHLQPQQTVRSVGEISKVVGLTLKSLGPIASLGDLVAIEANNPDQPENLAEVVGFSDKHTLLMPLDGVEGISSGNTVLRINEGFRIGVGDALLGRVVDALCRPLDDKGVIHAKKWRKVWQPAPNSMTRPRIKNQFFTGIRSIDAALPCGNGQRLGIFAGSGVGKSTLLGMICRHSVSDVNVIALIGERGKEVREFIEESLGEQGLQKSVVVVVTSDRPALQRVKGAEAAMAIAEYFRDQGKNVFFVMDSVTRYAMAQREIGLAIGEPPATKGYPPSVFGLLPKLLERAGTSKHGTITAFCTVLVEGDDLNDPIADTVRGILDGHIVLSRELAMQGQYPPVDILASVSRVVNDVADEQHKTLISQLRKQLATYKKAEDIISIGAYKKGSNIDTDRAVTLKPHIDAFLRQQVNDKSTWVDTLAKLKEILKK